MNPDTLMKKISGMSSSTWWLLLVMSPVLLPDFFSWRTYFDPIGNPILYVLWMIGFVLKYISAILAIVGTFIHLRRWNYPITALLLFFSWNIISSLINGRNIYDSYNTFLICVPFSCYLLSLFNVKNTGQNLMRVLTVLYRFSLLVCGLTIFFYLVFPRGFGTVFGSCAFAGGRACNNFIGIHADVSVYGIVLVMLSYSIYKITKSKRFLLVNFCLAIVLLFFSTSAAAKVIAALLVISVCVGALARKMSLVRRVLSIIVSPTFMGVVFFAFSLALPIVTSTALFKGFMVNVLHRSADMTGRLALYETSIREFISSPFFGHGYSDAYYLSVLRTNSGQPMVIPHNAFLQILMSTGIVGAIFFLFMLWTFTHKTSKHLRDIDFIVVSLLVDCSFVAAATFRDLYTPRFIFLITMVYIFKQANEMEWLRVSELSKRKKHVLLFMGKVDMGGIETLLLGIIPRLSSRYEFVVVSYVPGENELGSQFKAAGCQMIHITIDRKLHPLMFIKELRGVMKKNQIDVLHCNTGYSTFYGLVAGAIERIPVRIAHSHNSEFGDAASKANSLFKYLCKLSCLLFATERVAIGGVAARAMFLPHSSYYFVPNGIDKQRFTFDPQRRKQLRQALGITDETKVLLHIGRFTRQKNQVFLVNVFAAFKTIESHSKLVMIGTGEDYEKVVAEVSNLNLGDSVIMPGVVDNTEDFYSMADCFVFPSVYEGLGIVLIEAQANGLECLVSDAVEHGVKLGDLVHFKSLEEDYEHWAKEVQALVSSGRDHAGADLGPYNISNTAKIIGQIYSGEYGGRPHHA